MTHFITQRAERLAAKLRHQSIDAVLQVLVGRERLSLKQQRAVFRVMGRRAIVDSVQHSANPITAQRGAADFAAVSANQTVRVGEVGNNAYPAPIPSLITPQADVAALAEVLQRHLGYDTHVLKDAGKAQILCELERMAKKAGPDDSILIYYAGHGYLREDTGEGYWIPADASTKTATHWIGSADLAAALNQVRARQIMVVADSCYSGALTRERPGGIDKTADMLLKRSVMIMSSLRAIQRVPTTYSRLWRPRELDRTDPLRSPPEPVLRLGLPMAPVIVRVHILAGSAERGMAQRLADKV